MDNDNNQSLPAQEPACGCGCEMCNAMQHNQCMTGMCRMKAPMTSVDQAQTPNTNGAVPAAPAENITPEEQDINQQ